MVKKKLNELVEGERFRFTWDPETRVRTACQVGKIEIYCPYDGQNTMGHSKGGGEEVYVRSGSEVIMVTRTMTITVENVPDGIFDMIWVAAIQNAPTKIISDIKSETISLDFHTMDNKLAKPLAELLTIATTLATITQYQKEKN